MNAKRSLTPKQRQFLGMRRNATLRMSPLELRVALGANKPLRPTAPLDYEIDEDDMLGDDECPAFDDMDGEEDGDDSDE